jgi:hypothetical protein
MERRFWDPALTPFKIIQNFCGQAYLSCYNIYEHMFITKGGWFEAQEDEMGKMRAGGEVFQASLQTPEGIRRGLSFP